MSLEAFGKAGQAFVFNMTLDDVGLAIHGTNTENVLTANAADQIINGVFNALAADTEIDISALSFYDGDGNLLSAVTALADGYEAKYVLANNASDTQICCIGWPMLTSQGDDADWPNVPTGYAPFGGIKVVNASGADFTIGTTALDASGITDTYYDLGFVPPRAI